MQRRLAIAWITALALLIGVLIPAYAGPLQQDGGLLTTVTETANFRAGPGQEWLILGTLEPGTVILLDGRDYTGLWVRGITSNGQVGWMASRLVAAPREQTSVLRSIWVEEPFTLAAPSGDAVSVPPPAASVPETAPENVAEPEVQAPAAPPNFGGGVLVTAANGVNLREAPDFAARRTGSLGYGESFRLDGRDSTNAWVRGVTDSGIVGWALVDYIVINYQQFSSLPVVEASTPFGLGAPSAPPPGAPPPTSEPAPAVPVPSFAPVVNAAPVSGFSYGGHVAGFSDYSAGQMHRAGMTWAKRQWRYLAGQNPGELAGWINEAHARGFRILIGIVGMPGQVNNSGYYEQYAAFVGGVAALGADAIEVWNEMNIDREWPSGSIDPARYVELLRQSFYAIKAANPSTLVISGAPAPTGFFGGCGPGGCDDNLYVAGMAAAGAASYLDCVGIHYNEGIIGPNQTSGDPRGNSSHYTRYFWGMINTYTAAFGRSRPLCFTELGYLSPEGYGPLPGGFAWAQNVTLHQQASWLDQAVSLAASSGRVRLLIIWNVDFTEYSSDPMAGYAIIRNGGACPACDALGH